MNMEVPNIEFFCGLEGTKDQVNIVNYQCPEFLGGEDPRVCSGYLKLGYLNSV